MSDYTLTDGSYAFEAGNEKFELLATVAAVIAITRRFEGENGTLPLNNATQKLASYHLEDCFFVINTGLGYELSNEQQNNIYRDLGLDKIAVIAITFIDFLINGGKKLETIIEGENKENQKAKPKAKN